MIERLFAPLAMKVAAGLQILSLGFIVLLMLAKAGETRRADKWQARAAEEVAAHQLMIADVKRVRAEQKAADADHARQVEQSQVSISRETSSDYQAALADLRRRYDALRLQSGKAAADSGGGGDADMPLISGAAGRSDGAAGEEGFPDADRFLCSALAWQLESLQQWVQAQQAIAR